MPPPGSPTQSIAGQENFRGLDDYYSNEDVAILHDIVTLAQELLHTLPEQERLPTNALFGAYDDILPRLGIDADHDRRYARVLFRIGGIRGPGTLYEKFEEIMSRMGIDIEFDIHDDSYDDSQYDDSQTNLQSEAGHRSHQDDQTQTRDHRRRKSESSAWVSGDEIRSIRKTRRTSHSFGDKISNHYEETDVLQEILPKPIHLPKSTDGSKEDKAIENAGSWLESRPEIPDRIARSRSGSAHGSIHIRRRSLSRGPPTSTVIPSIPTSNDHRLGQNESTAGTSYFGDDDAVERWDHMKSPPERPIFSTSESLMQVKASVILQDHLNFLAKQQLRLWKSKALQLREDNMGLNIIAKHFNKRILGRAVLGIWRDQAVELRKARITKDFFEQLEARATRARDMYLMHMAFTHWSTYANEQVKRTELARRHIVRSRIFNAWRDITAVNELKVRRQVLKKFFSLWRRQHDLFAYDEITAVQNYQSGLVRKVLMDWIQKLKEARATAWWAEGAKRRTLFHWIVASHEAWEAHRISEEERRFRLIWNAWSIWRNKTQVHAQQIIEADDHYRINLSRSQLRKWRRETRIIPAKTIIQTDVSVRLLKETFCSWRQRTLMERTASSFNRMKMLREALTLWRLQGRAKVVTTFVGDRLKAQVIYKFSIAHRSHGAVKTLNQKRLRESFQVWVYRWRQAREQRWEQEDLAYSFAVKRSQNLALAQWYSQMGHRKSLEVAALDYHEPRLLGGIISKWSEKTHHQQQLGKRAKDAEFYFLATKTLKRWKASTEHSRREKRKTAYAQVRRMVKISLVRGVLQTWHEQAQHIVDLQSQATAVKENRNVILGMEIFDRWRGRAEELAELESLYRETVLKKQFGVWKERSEGLHALETEAMITYQERRQSRAVKKWSLATLQLRAQSNYASNICEKNAKKTFRKMFNYWHQKTRQRRPWQRVEASESDQLLGTTARAETWSDYGGEGGGIDEWARGLDEATASTPIPGYLATPSKVNRAERVMAAAARFSTTPKAPLSTPFERQLRAQYSGGQFQSLRKGYGRSTLGLGGGFADIPEHSMNNERESRG